MGANAAEHDVTRKTVDGRRQTGDRQRRSNDAAPLGTTVCRLPSTVCSDDDKPHEECGVFAVYGPGDDVARLTYFGLFALQHRGQESAGIAVSDGERLRCHKAMGLVT